MMSAACSCRAACATLLNNCSKMHIRWCTKKGANLAGLCCVARQNHAMCSYGCRWG